MLRTIRPLAAFVGVFLPLFGCARYPYRVSIDAAPWIRALGSDELFESDPAENKLVNLGPEAVPLLETALEREPAPVRVGVIGVLGRLQLPEAEALLLRAAANDPDEEVRYEAVFALGNLKGLRRGQVAEAALDDSSARVRMVAVQQCATLCSSPAAIGRVVQIAIHDPAPHNWGWARLTLSAILNEDPKIPRAAEAKAAIEQQARPLLASGDTYGERTRAALLLAQVGDPAAEPVLVQAVRAGEGQSGRPHAVYALGEVGDRDAVPVLTDRLGSPDAMTVSYSYDALRKLADRGVPGAAAALKAYTGPVPPRGLPPPPP